MFLLYSINLINMRNPQLIDRLSRTLSAPKRCCICSKMVYFKTIRCKKCRYVMHASCNNSSNHFCQNTPIDNYDKSDSNNSLFNNLQNTPNSSQDISQKTSIDNLDYWRFMSSTDSNICHNLTDNLIYDELPVFHSNLTPKQLDVPKSADYQLNKNHFSKQQRNSSLDGTSFSKFSFNFVNESISSKSTPNTPFKLRKDRNNNITELDESDEEGTSLSIKCNQLKSSFMTNNSKLTSCIKNWFYAKTGRRNSKDSLTKANLADKPVRSKYSLTIDDKITTKQLQNLIKKNKKANKVRFDVSDQQQQQQQKHLFNNKQMPQHRPLTPRSHNVEQFLFEQQRLIESQKQFNNLPPNPNSNTFAFVQTHVISSPIHQQQFNFSNKSLDKPMTKLEKKLAEAKKELLENRSLSNDNQSLTQKDSYGVEHYYCPSKVGYQKRHIPKLFKNNQNIFPDTKIDNDLLKAEKQILTKARTLSMEAKTDVCQSFFATWPTTSIIVGKVEDLTATEEEINRSLISSSYENNLNEDIDEVIKEWSIPSKDIQFDTLLRQSRKGEIYKGHWHGEVLIYTFNKNPTSDEDMYQFRKELAQLSKIRHENIMLFMGACIEPNNLAVITSMQKGTSVYEAIHKKQQNLQFSTKLNILRQVAQAMGYLHARGIIHKKISSNNIILENKVKICLMDQGFNTYDYNSKNYAVAAKGHLTYLSPELIRSLCIEKTPNYSISHDYTKESDVYAFGTLLFEILSNKYPYQKLETDQIIWKIGNGIHESVEQLKCDSILKSLLSRCWSPAPEKRPAFSLIVKNLQENVSFNKRHSSSEPERLNKLGLSRHI